MEHAIAIQYDERVVHILELIKQFQKSDFKSHAKISEKRDVLDDIIIGLNKLGEVLAAKEFYNEENHRRINEIAEVLLKHTLMDFSQKVTVTGKRDELDAIAVGLNTVSEELETQIRELKESEKKFRLIMENVKDYAIIMLDADGYIKSWNLGAERLKGYKENEILGKHFSVFYTEEEILRKEPERNLKITRKEGRHESEGWRVRKDGSRFFADAIFTALYDDNNNFQGFAKITRDITERKKIESEVKQKSEDLAQTNEALVIHIEKYEKANAELVRSNKQLEQFVYIASHDLQEPLRTISNFVGLIEAEYAGKLDEGMNQYLEFIMSGTAKMKNLIKDLLDYSRLGLQTTFAKVDCDSILNEVIAEMDASIKESNAQITSDTLPIIDGNEIQLKQLFQNLLSNAIKFHKKNIGPEIKITVEEKNTEYIFAFKDNGIGIDERDIGKLFVFFKRLHNATEYPGNGIGLTTAQKIVVNHNGRIWVESKLGKGSTFYFTISKRLE